MTSMVITKAGPLDREQISALLDSEKLPKDDLPASLDHFFVVRVNDNVVASIGLEPYEDFALLRSMVVNKDFRNRNLAGELNDSLEQHARDIGVRQIFLLTETAERYFLKKGYSIISREEVPGTVRASTEFSLVCPVSAVVMRKNIPS